MTASLARLRKRAAELEQKRQFDKALEVYIQILDEGGKDLGDEDVPLFNRVGDMLMRSGSVTEALGYYERAVDLYAERGFLNNAIALCSKILRQSPGRAAVYYKLGRISARKGFKSDARKNFLEYADRMQKAGQSEEAFRALKEFAALYPDQDDVRLILAELLSKENRKGEALEQLQELYQKLESEGRRAEARATIDRMRAIDPSATPREGAVPAVSGAGDLVFLDLSEEMTRPPGRVSAPVQAQPSSVTVPEAPQVPALSGLAVTFLPDESEPDHPEGFEATAVTDVPAPAAAPADAGAYADAPRSGAEEDWEGADDETATVPVETVELATLEAASVEPVSLLDDFEPTSAEPAASGLEMPPPSGAHTLSGSEFAELDLEEVPRPALVREHELALPGELPSLPDQDAADQGPVPAIEVPVPGSDAAHDDARTAAEEAAELEADITALAALQHAPVPMAASHSSSPGAGDEVLADDAEPFPDDEEGVFFGAADIDGAKDVLPVELAPGPAVPDDFLTAPPSFGDSGEAREHAFPPLPGLDDAGLADVASPRGAVAPEDDAEPPASHAAASTISIGGAEGHLRQRLELEPENWELRRMLGEALLDAGDRDGGLYEMELAMVGFELDGDLDRAQEVIDEILEVQPASVRHHQKRVEYAVRSRDRRRLANAYLELADALFRTGVGDKAVAVYSRVLELDSENERAEFALVTLAPDVLLKLRGAPSRPGRWTDELEAIDGPVRRETPAAPGVAAHDSANGEALRSDEVDAPPTRDAVGEEELRLNVDTPEHDETGAGEAAAELDASELEAVLPDDAVTSSAAASDVADAATATATPAEDGPAPIVAAAGQGAGSDSGEPGEPDDSSAAAESVDATGEDEFRLPTDVSPVDQAEPAPVDAGPEGVPELATGASDVPGAESRNGAEPAPPPGTRLDRARRLTPGAGGSDFVDLGEWLRATEPVRSTRMLVEDPKPTGDEQADFDELLRRFKRGVAENVEAEDYEAHYDLGVAYKEMGLVDEAIAQFQKALRGSSHRVRSYEALGQCFVEKEQYPIAAALLQRATELPGTDDQQLVGVLYLLGFATEHMGRPAEALPYYLRVFAVDIEFRDIAQRVAAMGNATT